MPVAAASRTVPGVLALLLIPALAVPPSAAPASAAAALAAAAAGTGGSAGSLSGGRPAPAGPVETTGLDRAALRQALDAIPAAGAPGASAEVRSGPETWAGAAGVADLSTGRPARPHLRHRVGSINKTFVAATLLQLAGEGRLGLDDPVVRWLPRLSGLDRRVTVRMLLQQNSGINDYDHVIFSTLEQILANRPYTPWELAAIGLAQPRVGEPGQRWSYANTNYVLAGLVLERVTGRDAATEITRRIIRPLGLRDTYFPGSSPVIRGKHANGYVPWTDGLRDFTAHQTSWAWMAGELISTTADLNRFYRALLGGHLLPPAQLAEMRRTVPTAPASPDGNGYGLGLLSVATPCGPVWGHDGVVFGYATTSLHSPDGSRQATLATNISHYQESFDPPHPIDAASGAFLMAALCGPGPRLTDHPGALGRTAGPALPRR